MSATSVDPQVRPSGEALQPPRSPPPPSLGTVPRRRPGAVAMSWGGPEAPQPQLRQTPAAPEQALSPPPSPQPSPVSRGFCSDDVTVFLKLTFFYFPLFFFFFFLLFFTRSPAVALQRPKGQDNKGEDRAGILPLELLLQELGYLHTCRLAGRCCW